MLPPHQAAVTSIYEESEKYFLCHHHLFVSALIRKPPTSIVSVLQILQSRLPKFLCHVIFLTALGGLGDLLKDIANSV